MNKNNLNNKINSDIMNSDYKDDIKNYNTKFKEEDECISIINNNKFKVAFYEISEKYRKKHNIKVEVMARRFHTNQRSLLDIRKGNLKNKRIFLAVLLYLKVSTLIIMKLLEKSEFKLLAENLDDNVYEHIIYSCAELDFDYIENIIKEEGATPLLS